MNRDPKRLFSENDRAIVRAGQHGRCGVCQEHLPDDFHMHHVIPWALGGPTVVANAMAVCPPCHRIAPTAPLPAITPRTWQSENLPRVLSRILDGHPATAHVGPGGGKTLFTGMVVTELMVRSVVERVIVFVPNDNLRGQWAKALKPLGIHLDAEPRYAAERRGYQGAVFTYQQLSNSETVRMLADDANSGTLVVFDEVHHLGRDAKDGNRSWSQGALAIAGTVEDPKVPVLNLSGTLFRSRKSERISTVEYQPVEGDSTKIEVAVDVDVSTARLVESGELRNIAVNAYDAGLQVVSLDSGDVTDVSRVIDIDADNRRVRSSALDGMLTDRDNVVAPMVDAMIAKMAHQGEALAGPDGHYPIKGLVVCDSIKHAQEVYDVVGERFSSRFTMLATSADSDAARNIAAFRDSRQQSILVTARMVSEGFDAPDIGTLLYLTRWQAPLFVTQMVARAMRVTQRERELGRKLPAEILIPGDKALIAAFNDVLVGKMRMLDVEAEACRLCGREACYCDNMRVRHKTCIECGQPYRICVCTCSRCGGRRYRCHCPKKITEATHEVTVTSAAELAGLSHDGADLSIDLAGALNMTKVGLPEAYRTPVAALMEQLAQDNPTVLHGLLHDDKTERNSA